LVKVHCWRIRPGHGDIKYAMAHTKWKDGKRRTIKMHRLIMGLTDPEFEVDHEDRNGLNNQKYNLQVVTKARNVQLAYIRRKERQLHIINNLQAECSI
jgi:hypothetical protein